MDEKELKELIKGALDATGATVGAVAIMADDQDVPAEILRHYTLLYTIVLVVFSCRNLEQDC